MSESSAAVSVAKPTLLAKDGHKDEIDIYNRGGVKAAPAQTSGGAAQGKSDKR